MSDEATPEVRPDETVAPEQPDVVEAPHEADETDWKAEARKWESRSKDNHTTVQDLQGKLDGILTALGLGDKQEDPAKAVEQYKAQATAAEQRLAVFTSTPAGVDVNALLDSQAFVKSLDGVDADRFGEHITAFVEANPRFKTVPTAAGARDAAQRGTTPAPVASMDDFLRGRR